MKYADEFRDPKAARAVLERIVKAHEEGRPVDDAIAQARETLAGAE